jgi:hypothetical protein
MYFAPVPIAVRVHFGADAQRGKSIWFFVPLLFPF